MYRMITILLLLSSTTVVCGAGTPFIDSDYKQTDMSKDQQVDECFKKARNVIEKGICSRTIRGNRRHSGPPPRGTQDYCEYKYKPTSFEQKKQTLDTLRVQQPTARRKRDLPSTGRLPGEVTQEHFQTEIVCVEAMLAGDQEDQIKGLRDRLGLGR